MTNYSHAWLVLQALLHAEAEARKPYGQPLERWQAAQAAAAALSDAQEAARAATVNGVAMRASDM